MHLIFMYKSQRRQGRFSVTVSSTFCGKLFWMEGMRGMLMEPICIGSFRVMRANCTFIVQYKGSQPNNVFVLDFVPTLFCYSHFYYPQTEMAIRTKGEVFF